MEGLLFLVHRIPYPPNKGDKIRSFNILKYLSERYDVYLGTFIDDPADRTHLDALRPYCRDAAGFEINPLARKILSLSGLLSGLPLSIPYYSKPDMHSWVRKCIEEQNISKALVFSSSMAQYIDNPAFARLVRIIDFVDIDSEKWRAYGRRMHFPLSKIYSREAHTMFAYEVRIAGEFDHSLFVSNAEAALFKDLSGLPGGKVDAVHNGVDLSYFNPDFSAANPYHPDRQVVVFTGAMDYWANEDAVCWFGNEIFGRIRDVVENAEFWIVGSKPTGNVQRLANSPGITVTGAVADVRPFVRYADAAVAPLRVARGIQNKILEAMAMAKPVVATPQAIEGIEIGAEYARLITEDPVKMAEIVCEVLTRNGSDSLGALGRKYVETHHDWDSQLEKINTLLARDRDGTQ